MNDPERIEYIVQLLKNDHSLSSSTSVASPQAIMMPFANDQKKRYVMISLFVDEQSLKKSTLVLACKRVIEVLRQNHAIDDLGGVEIMPSIVREGRSKRIFRLSILSHALKAAEQLSSADLGKAEPIEGMTCILYLGDLSD